MRKHTGYLSLLLCACVVLSPITGCNTVEEHPNDHTQHSDTPLCTTATTTTTATTSATTTTTITTAAVTTSTKATTTSQRATTTIRPSIPVTTTIPTISGSHLIDAPLIAQRPKYPSGCESVSAVMLLNYWGENISVDTFIDDYLPKSTNFYTKKDVFYGPSPYEYFIGDPRTTKSYGCMAPVIQRAIDTYYGENSPVKNVTGLSLQELCKEYIDNNQPVLVWVTIGMVETYLGDSWHLADGSVFSWPVNEHCMILVGYDKTHYYFNDPYTGQLKKYPHWLCNDRYNALGKQAVVIVK